MDLKLLNIAVSKLSDDIVKLQEQYADVLHKLNILQAPKVALETSSQVIQNTDTEFITLKQVREILKMSRNSVLQMARNGLVRQVRLTKRTVRYVKSEILALIKS